MLSGLDGELQVGVGIEEHPLLQTNCLQVFTWTRRGSEGHTGKNVGSLPAIVGERNLHVLAFSHKPNHGQQTPRTSLEMCLKDGGFWLPEVFLMHVFNKTRIKNPLILNV